MKKVLLVVLALALVAAVPVQAGKELAASKELAEGQARVTIPTKGMSCGACCSKIETALKKMDGIVDVKADYAKGLTTVTFVEDQVAVDKIIKAINDKTSFSATMPKKKS